MFYQAAKKTVFRQYNTAIALAFVAIVLIALSISSYRYFSEVALQKTRGLAVLNIQATQLNDMLKQSVQAVTGIQKFAQYSLKFPSELTAKLPKLAQDDELFYLDQPRPDVLEQRKLFSGNITGFGNVHNFSELKKQEIAMANALTPAFVAAQQIISEATWFYYVSLEHFVNIYPWIGRDNWHFSEKMIINVHNLKIQKLQRYNNRIVWSAPYLDAAGKGMHSSLGMGVFRGQKQLGAVIIDINLARLHESLPELDTPEQGMVLFNEKNQILMFKHPGRPPLTAEISWQEAMPKSLQQLSFSNLSLFENSTKIDDWLIEKQVLPVNGWTLLKYQAYPEFTAPLFNRFVFNFAMSFSGLFAFLMLVNYMTKRSFIQPTTEFIRHIEYCAEGDPGKVKPSADWLHWFQVVEDIFGQNRGLLLQLKEQNAVLDSRVNEKTQALQERSLKHQRDYALLRSVINAIPELIIFNDSQGQMIGCNKSFEYLANKNEKEMLGIQAGLFLPIPLATKVPQTAQLTDIDFPQQGVVEADENIYEYYSNQFLNDSGGILGTISIFRDVTEQYTIQSALEKAKNQAEYANQVKIQFLANMSHEIRTPINAMQGMMDLLNSTQLDSRQLHYLLNAQSAGSSLLHLIDELLDLSKIEAGKMLLNEETVNLALIVEKAVKLNVAAIHAKGLNMIIELAVDVPEFVITDEMRLIQVISNLLNNATKFTEKGEIKLNIDIIASSGIHSKDKNALVRFKVTDTGIGVAKDKQAHLFEAFNQADVSMTRKYGGSGLGLSICQQIVNLLGGEIHIESNIGQGSELSFVLPMSVPEQQLIAFNKNQGGNYKIEEADCVIPLNIIICAIGQKLSHSLITTIKARGWKYLSLDSLVAIKEGSFDAPIVLLIDEKTLAEQEPELLTNESTLCWQGKVKLLGICQPAMVQLASQTCQHLEALCLPYVLLDTPLYRYSLDKIQQNFMVDMVNESKNSESRSQLMPLNSNATNTQLTIANGDKSLLNKAIVNKERMTTSVSPGMSDGIRDIEKDNALAGIHVLLVEDNLVNQLVAKELLLNLQAKVSIADNGEKAIEMLNGQMFDVVLMDIQMPVMDGLTATEYLRKQPEFKQLPIIAMTAHARAEDKAQSLASGMNLHIAKPVTGKLLLESILQVLSDNDVKK